MDANYENLDLNQWISDLEYVNKAMSNWLCNKPKQAEQFLNERIDKIPIFAAYSFVLSMVKF